MEEGSGEEHVKWKKQQMCYAVVKHQDGSRTTDILLLQLQHILAGVLEPNQQFLNMLFEIRITWGVY